MQEIRGLLLVQSKMLIESTRMLLIDLALVLGLLLTFRISFPSRLTAMLLRIGLLTILAEDVIRLLVGMAISMASKQVHPALDLIRSWTSILGAIGALLLCVGLARVFKERPRSL